MAYRAEQSSTTGWTWPSHSVRPASRAICARGSAWCARGFSVFLPARPKRRRRAPHPELDLCLERFRRGAADSRPGRRRGRGRYWPASASRSCHLREHLTPERNHRTLELYALFIAALALPQLDHDGELLDFAIGRAAAQPARRCDTPMAYTASARRTITWSRCAPSWRSRKRPPRFGIAFSRRVRRRLARACEFAMHMPPARRPDPGAVGQRYAAAMPSCSSWRPGCSTVRTSCMSRQPAQAARRPGSAAPAFRAAATSSSAAAGGKRRGCRTSGT